MKKLKRLFNPNLTDKQQITPKQTLQVQQIKSHVIPQQQHKQQLMQSSNICQACKQNSSLIAKYANLIKLLKIKISKLQKQLIQMQDQHKKSSIEDFQDFKMEFESCSLETVKNNNRSEKVCNTFKEIDFNSRTSNKKDTEKEELFDKTVRKQETVKEKKSLKKFVSEFKILDEQCQNRKPHNLRTQRQIGKKQKQIDKNKMKDQKPKQQIGFLNLMQKSQISIQSSHHCPFITDKSSHASSIDHLEISSDPKTSFQSIHLVQANQKPSALQKRIQFMAQTIMDLKSFVLHVRHSIFQLVKMTNIQQLRHKQPEAYYMLGIIVRIFQFSEDQIEKMFRKQDRVKIRQNPKNRLKQFFYSTIGR